MKRKYLDITRENIASVLFHSIHGFFPTERIHIVGGGYDKMADAIYLEFFARQEQDENAAIAKAEGK